MTANSTLEAPAECTSTNSASSFKLLHVIASMETIHGGPPEAIRQLSQTLAKEGHYSEAACLDRPGRFETDESELKIHALGPGLGKYHYSRSFIPWLRANVGRFDFVIAHDVWQYPCLATWRALRYSTTPYFVFTHGMLDPWFRRTFPLKHLKKAAYWRAAGYPILRDARGVFFTSEAEQHLASQSFRPYECKGLTLGFGTTGAPGDPIDLKRGFLDAFPELRGQKLLLYLSRVHPKKGLDLLIEAFAKARDNDNHLQLVIAGPFDKEWKAHLERQASHLGVATRITWTGLLTNQQKWGAFYASEVFCLPSHQENFALVVTEALSCGLPVLISDKVNIWREIESARAGFVGNDDISGTTQCLARWLALSPDEQNAMRQCARNCFNRSFKLETAAQVLIKALRGSRSATPLGAS